jgi:chitin synthase
LGSHNRPTAGGRHSDEAMHSEQLKGALKTIGLAKRHIAQTCQLITAILHLSNLEFTIS